VTQKILYVGLSICSLFGF